MDPHHITQSPAGPKGAVLVVDHTGRVFEREADFLQIYREWAAGTVIAVVALRQITVFRSRVPKPPLPGAAVPLFTVTNLNFVK